MIHEPLAHILTEGGKTNSLGRVNEVVDLVLKNKQLLEELYDCLRHDNAWVRMRAADALEKVCRVHPDWIAPYIDSIQKDFSNPEQQPSIKWHLAQIYMQVPLTHAQKQQALEWLAFQLKNVDVDWIVAANCMQALAAFVKNNDYSVNDLINLLAIQQKHKSKSVVRKATQILGTL